MKILIIFGPGILVGLILFAVLEAKYYDGKCALCDGQTWWDKKTRFWVCPECDAFYECKPGFKHWVPRFKKWYSQITGNPLRIRR